MTNAPSQTACLGSRHSFNALRARSIEGVKAEWRRVRRRPVATEIDFTDPDRQKALERAKELIVSGYRILRDEVGADNPADNAFLREARICAKAGVIWVGDRGGADGRTEDGDEVEIKSTRLDARPSIQFPTSRYVSPTVIDRFREATFWLFGVFDLYEELIAIYRVEGYDMARLIDALERRMQRRAAEGLALENNPKLPFSDIYPMAVRIFRHPSFLEQAHPTQGWTIKPQNAPSL